MIGHSTSLYQTKNPQKSRELRCSSDFSSRLYLFSIYINPLSDIIDSNTITNHSYFDNVQLQISSTPEKISKLLHSVQSCICDIKARVTANTTNFMFVTLKSTNNFPNLLTSTTIRNALLLFKKSVKNWDLH